MGETQQLRRQLDDEAIARVLDHLHESRNNGRLLFPLADLAEATAIDPITVESVMRLLERTGPFEVAPVKNGYAETRWTVQGSPYDLDGLRSDTWNVPARYSK